MQRLTNAQTYLENQVTSFRKQLEVWNNPSFQKKNKQGKIEDLVKNTDTKEATTTETKTESVPTPPKAATKPSVDVAGKKVSDALLKNDPKSLFGKKVYAYNDKTPVYTIQDKPLTVVKKGQLLGTFSNPRPIKSGGNSIVIVSNDPKNKFIVVKDAYLTF